MCVSRRAIFQVVFGNLSPLSLILLQIKHRLILLVNARCIVCLLACFSQRLGRFIPMQPRCRSRLLSARTLSSTYAYLNDQGRARSVNGPLKISTRNKAERGP